MFEHRERLHHLFEHRGKFRHLFGRHLHYTARFVSRVNVCTGFISRVIVSTGFVSKVISTRIVSRNTSTRVVTGVISRNIVSRMNGAGVVANHITEESLGICGRSLVLRAVLREMTQLSTLETTGPSEEIIHLSPLWATTPFVRSVSRLGLSSLC